MGRSRLGGTCAPVVLLAALCCGGFPAGAQDRACAVPEGLVLRPGVPLRLGGTVFELAAARRERPDRVELDLDLLTRRSAPGGRVAVRGTYRPLLDVRYALSGSGGREVASGRLEFRSSSAGPSYGTTLALEEAQIAKLSLHVTVRHREGAVRDPGDDRCPELSLDLDFALGDLEPTAGPSSGALRAPADNLRVNLIGTLDPDPAEETPYNDVWGYDGGSVQLAILGANDGTYFIDVTDAGNPVEVGFVPGASSGWRDMKTYSHYAYIVTEGFQGLQIVDLSDPLDPTLVNTTFEFFTTAHNIFIDTAVGQAWVLGTDAGTRILDLATDPEDPIEVGFIPTPYVHDAFVADNLAYLSHINEGLHRIVDSSDPANLTTLSLLPTPSGVSHNSWTNDDATLLATTDERDPGGHVAVFDISDKTSPVLLSEYKPSSTTLVHNVLFDDDDDELIAMSYYALGFKLVDLHVPTIPIEIASYDTYPLNDMTFDGAWGIYSFDPRGYHYVSDRDTGLYVLEYAPTGGTFYGRVTDPLTGVPIADAEVLILSDGLVEHTGPDGRFGTYVDAGKIVVRVRAVGYETEFVNAGAMPIGGRLDLDVELERLPGSPLSGTVRRMTDAAAVADATVQIVGTQLSTTTAADGTYSFPEVAIGHQTVTADAFAYAPAEGRIMIGENRPSTLDLELEPAVFADDGESDLGWLFSGLASSGMWERVDPNGTAGGTVQPEDDHTADPGTQAFITGQSPPGADVEDNNVEGGLANLTSPIIDLSGLGAARLRYYRWMSNTAGFVTIGTFRAQALIPGEIHELEALGTEENSWTRREFDLGSFVRLTDSTRVRFVADPGPFFPEFQVLECGVDDIDVVRACRARFSPELDDTDGDGVVDPCDDCPLDPANDADGDGFCGDVDNTPFTAAADQDDSDGDGVGDAADNCVVDANPDQRDLDGDGLGNACDPDLDGDGLADESDGDRDGDGVPDASDLCPSAADGTQADDDGDLEGNACDDDDGLVTGVRLHAGGLITWHPESVTLSYNLYRGDLGPEELVYFADCARQALAPYSVDPDLPIPGDGFFYLVTRIGAGGEGSPGQNSSGIEREIGAACP